jgi:hypothetical protein
MTLLITLLLTVNAIVHGVVVARYGFRDNNQPFFFFALIYAALAVALYFSVPYAIWAILILSTIGFVGLNVTFKKLVRDKTPDKLIWLLDAVTILSTGYLLFGR